MELQEISQEIKQEIDTKEEECRNKNRLHSLVLNKLCYDNNVYFIPESDFKKSSDPSGSINYPDLKEEENTPIKTEEEVSIFNSLQKLVYTKKSNILFLFLGTFIVSFFLYTIFCFIPIYYLLIAILKKIKSLPFIFHYLIMMTISCSSFFYYYLNYQLLKENPNQQFQGINTLTFTGAIYVIASLAGLKILLINSQYYSEDRQFLNELDDIEIPTDQLFFETMDRNSMSDFLIKGESHNFNQQDISRNLQYLSTCENEPTLQKKVWNSGFYLLLYKQKRDSAFAMSNLLKNVSLFFALVLEVLYAYLPLKYFPDRQEEDEWINVMMVGMCLPLFTTIFAFNCQGSLVAYESFSNVETFTSMLELQSVMPNHSFKKAVPSLNLYCTTSIKTWFYMRHFMLNKSQNILIISNLLQFIEVICFLSLTIFIGMDFLGIGMEKNTIYNNKLVFYIMITTIVSRFIFFIIPIFFNFSYVNDLLQYNKQQIYSIKRRLANILSSYKRHRNTWSNDLDVSAKYFHTEDQEKQDLSILEDTKTQPLKDNESCFKIEQFKVIFEIKRNTQLQYLINENEKLKYSELNEEQKISKEMEYLSALIRTYELIYQDMITQQDNHSLKFLGIIPITYKSGLSTLLFLLPTVFSLLMQRFSQ